MCVLVCVSVEINYAQNQLYITTQEPSLPRTSVCIKSTRVRDLCARGLLPVKFPFVLASELANFPFLVLRFKFPPALSSPLFFLFVSNQNRCSMRDAGDASLLMGSIN